MTTRTTLGEKLRLAVPACSATPPGAASLLPASRPPPSPAGVPVPLASGRRFALSTCLASADASSSATSTSAPGPRHERHGCAALHPAPHPNLFPEQAHVYTRLTAASAGWAAGRETMKQHLHTLIVVGIAGAAIVAGAPATAPRVGRCRPGRRSPTGRRPTRLSRSRSRARRSRAASGGSPAPTTPRSCASRASARSRTAPSGSRSGPPGRHDPDHLRAHQRRDRQGLRRTDLRDHRRRQACSPTPADSGSQTAGCGSAVVPTKAPRKGHACAASCCSLSPPRSSRPQRSRSPLPGHDPAPERVAARGHRGRQGHEFYAGSLATGAVYAGGLRTGPGNVLDPVAGHAATGLKYDHGQLWVSGAGTGKAVYTRNGRVAEGVPARDQWPPTFINDVVVTGRAAYFTDSQRPVIYKVAKSPARVARRRDRVHAHRRLSARRPAST